MKRPITRLELGLVLALVIAAGVYATVTNAYFDLIETTAGTVGNPASGNERVYGDSGTHKLSCLTSSGGNCAPTGGGGSGVTLPQIGVGLTSLNDPNGFTYTWFNQASSTITTNGASLVLTTPTSGGNNLSGRTTPVTGSMPYTVTLGMIPNLYNTSSMQCGLVITDGSNYIVIRYRNDTTIDIFTWTGTGTPTTNLFTGGAPTLTTPFPIVFLQIQETSVTRFYRGGTDGVNFQNFFNEAKATFLTATRAGFFCLNSTSSAFTAAMTAVHFTSSAP